MAEINIQKKKRPVWPWIIIIIIVLIAAWFLIEKPDLEEVAGKILPDDSTSQNITSSDTSYTSEEVNEYVNFINNNSEQNGEEEEFIKEGVKKLSTALSEIADDQFPRDAEINNQVNFIEEKADDINNFNKDSEQISQIFKSTVDVFNSMEKKNGNNNQNEIENVKNIAQKIQPDKPAVRQQKEIVNFLRESGDVLRNFAADDETDKKRY